MLITVLHQSSRLWDLGPATGACLPLKNSWRQPLDGATHREVVRLASQHHLCGCESVAYSSASLRACWWRALWTSVVTATATVTDIYHLNHWTDTNSVLCLAFSVSVLKDNKSHNTWNALYWNFTRSASMSVSKCCVSVIGLCYILCMLQHFDWGGGVFRTRCRVGDRLFYLCQPCSKEDGEVITGLYMTASVRRILWLLAAANWSRTRHINVGN